MRCCHVAASSGCGPSGVVLAAAHSSLLHHQCYKYACVHRQLFTALFQLQGCGCLVIRLPQRVQAYIAAVNCYLLTNARDHHPDAQQPGVGYAAARASAELRARRHLSI
jgi:hypothetical protein